MSQYVWKMLSMINDATEICEGLQYTRHEHSMAKKYTLCKLFWSFQFCTLWPPLEELLEALNENTNEVGFSINQETTKY